MPIILNSLFPIFTVIVLGYIAKHYKFLLPEFWPSCEKLAYYVLLPLILFTNIATAPYNNIGSYLHMIYASILAVIIVIIIMFMAKGLFKINNPDFTSILQGSIYANAAYIGIPASFALFGQEGLSTYSLLLAAIVPFVNAATITILGIYSHQGGGLFKMVARKLAFHPIIIACIAGFIFNYLGISLPKPIFNTLDMLGKAGIAIGLVIVGAALDIKAIKGSGIYISSPLVIKLLVMPGIVIVLAKWFGISGIMANIMVLYATLPAAAATYILARKMNGNAQLMAGIIVLETALSFITMSVMLDFALKAFPL